MQCTQNNMKNIDIHSNYQHLTIFATLAKPNFCLWSCLQGNTFKVKPLQTAFTNNTFFVMQCLRACGTIPHRFLLKFCGNDLHCLPSLCIKVLLNGREAHMAVKASSCLHIPANVCISQQPVTMECRHNRVSLCKPAQHGCKKDANISIMYAVIERRCIIGTIRVHTE